MSDLNNPFGPFDDDDPFTASQPSHPQPTMTPERRMALHDALAAAVHYPDGKGTVKLTVASAQALSDYLIVLEMLLQEIDNEWLTMPIGLRERIEHLPMPTWTRDP